jgi:hypothetical protein
MSTSSPVSTDTEPAATPEPPADQDKAAGFGSRALRAVLTQRELLLVILTVVVLAWLTYLSYGGYLYGDYDADYLSLSLVDAVPLAMLAFAELIVIVSGEGASTCPSVRRCRWPAWSSGSPTASGRGRWSSPCRRRSPSVACSALSTAS